MRPSHAARTEAPHDPNDPCPAFHPALRCPLHSLFAGLRRAIGDRLKSPPVILPVALQESVQGRLGALGRPSFGLGRSRAQLRPPPPLKRPREPYLTTFTQATGAGGQYRRLSGPSPPPATVTTPRPLGSVPSGLCWFRDARESAPPPLRKMRMPRMWRAAASAAAPHSQPRGAWLKPRLARGDTGLRQLVGRPRPAPRRPYHVSHALERL